VRTICGMGTAFLLAAGVSCGSTGGALVTLPFRTGGQRAGGPLTFTTPSGWTVTLQTAKIALGPFYFNQFHPTQAFRSGLVIIQVTQQVIVDALDSSLRELPAGADGETGPSVAVEIGLFPPDSTQPSTIRVQLDGNVGLVAGTATKGATTLAFSGPIAIDTSVATPTNPLLAIQRVRGAAVDLVFTADPQALQLRVDPIHWFDLVDFADLLQGSASNGVYTWGLRSTFLNSLVQGVKGETGIYQFQLVPG
jgi:hypothetical protein